MVERRWHKKSRNGCDQCKQRRVKCDETLPICRGCIRRQCPCSYAEGPKPRQQSIDNNAVSGAASVTSNTASASPQALQPADITSESGSGSHVPAYALELGLMHHFVVKTYKTCDAAVLPLGFFQDLLPRLAMEHDFLLYALLSFTCLHKAHLELEKLEYHRDLAITYRNRTLAILPTLFTDKNATASRPQAIACFWASALVGLIGLANASLSRISSAGGATRSSVDLLLEVAALWRGTRVIGDIYAPVVGADFADQLNPINPAMLSAASANAPEDIPSSFEAQLIRLRVRMEHDLSLSAPDRDLLLKSVDDLSRSLYLYRMQRGWGGIIAWFADRPPEFQELLNKGPPLVKLVMAFYGLSLHICRDVWYVGDIGTQLVDELTAGSSLADELVKATAAAIDPSDTTAQATAQSQSEEALQLIAWARAEAADLSSVSTGGLPNMEEAGETAVLDPVVAPWDAMAMATSSAPI